MKKLFLIALVGLVMTSCSMESYLCHTYGTTNRMTKHGMKAQHKYTKRHI